MNHPESFRPAFRLHQWLIQPDLNRISGPAGTSQVEPRVMAVLLALAQRPGDVLTRTQLLDQVWADAVVGEEILTRAVSELRRIFGDNARRPEYIETIRNHGYRLIAPVSKVAPAPTAGPKATTPVHARSLKPVGSWLRPLIVISLLSVLLIFLPRWLVRPESPDISVVSKFAATPLTSFPGREYHPALSADGTRVAFAWAGFAGDTTSIYIKQRNSESPLQLSREPGWAAWPTWSPDDQTVAFVQTAQQVSAICLVPSLGGAVRRVHHVAGLIEGLDWSPDGSKLAYSAQDSLRREPRLYVLDLATLTVKPASARRADNAGDLQPRFAPHDGRLAWIGLDRAGGSGIYLANGAGEKATVLVHGRDPMQGLAWSANGRWLVYATAVAGKYQLWQVDSAGGSPQPLPIADDFAWNPTIARKSGDLVYEQVRVDQDIWRATITDREAWAVTREPFITSTRWESSPEYKADGSEVAFVSARSGSPEIWLADAEGGSLRKLTSLRATALSNLRWSDSGKAIACNAVIAGEHQILIADVAGGAPKRVTTGHANELFASWSGTDLLVTADTETGWQVLRLPTDGAEATQITRTGGLIAQENAARRTLYFTRPDRAGLWRRRTGGRVTPELILPEMLPRDQFNWRLSDEKVIWVFRAGGTALLYEYDLAKDQSLLLAELPGFQGPGLAIAPSGDTFLYPKTGAAVGDLMLVEGWQGKN